MWDAGNVGNQYTFVGNNAVNEVDPMGLQPNSPGALRLFEARQRERDRGGPGPQLYGLPYQGPGRAAANRKRSRGLLPAGKKWDRFYREYDQLVEAKNKAGWTHTTFPGNLAVNLGIKKAGKCDDWARAITKALRPLLPYGYQLGEITRNPEATFPHVAVALFDQRGDVIGVLDPHSGGTWSNSGEASVYGLNEWVRGAPIGVDYNQQAHRDSLKPADQVAYDKHKKKQNWLKYYPY